MENAFGCRCQPLKVDTCIQTPQNMPHSTGVSRLSDFFGTVFPPYWQLTRNALVSRLTMDLLTGQPQATLPGHNSNSGAVAPREGAMVIRATGRIVRLAIALYALRRFLLLAFGSNSKDPIARQLTARGWRRLPKTKIRALASTL